MKKIALYGGSFNPFHNAHLDVMQNTLKQGLVDEIWVVPCKYHAFSKKSISSQDRVNMIKLAIKDLENVRVETIEVDSHEINYTINTVKKLKKLHDHEFFWIIGTDELCGIDKWYKSDELFKEIKFLVSERANFPFIQIPGINAQFIANKNKSDLSSSEIREKVKKKESISQLVSKEVEDYIIEKNLYKKIKNVLVIFSEKKTEEHLKVVENVKDILENCEVSFDFIDARDLRRELFKNIDLIITIGGDGTFIRASHFIDNQLILGINSESEFSEGALTTLDERNHERLREIFKGSFGIEKRDRIKIEKNGKVLKSRAMNEVYVGARNQFNTSRYILELNGVKEEHRSSGVLIVTADGSDAWYRSAGGEPYHEKVLKFLVREPFVCRVFNSKLLQGEIKDKIKFHSTMYKGGVIALDSNQIHYFNKGDCIELSVSEKPLNIVTIKT